MSINSELRKLQVEEAQRNFVEWKRKFIQSIQSEANRALERHSQPCCKCGRSRYSVYQKVWSLLSVERCHTSPHLLKRLAIVTQYGCNSVRIFWTRKIKSDELEVLTRKLDPTVDLTDELRWLVYKNLSVLGHGLNIEPEDCVPDLAAATKVCLLDSVDSVIAASLYYGWQPKICIGRHS